MPLIKYSHKEIVEAAFSVTRKNGWDKCTARSIARELGSSTMPIYSALKSMKSLKEQIANKASDLLLSYQKQTRTGLVFLDMGVGYVLFAQDEKNLFRMMYFTELEGEEAEDIAKKYRVYVFDRLLEVLQKDDGVLRGLSDEKKNDVLYRMWIFSHGLAVLINNARIDPMNEAEITKFLMETGSVMICGEQMGILNTTP